MNIKTSIKPVGLYGEKLFMGVVTIYENGKKIWDQSTNINRVSEHYAEVDANYLRKNIIEQNVK